jgi:putative membrane protein
MTRKFLITAAALAAVNGLALAQMGQSTAQQSQQQKDQQSMQSPTAQPAGNAMQGQQQQLTDQEFVKQAAARGQFEIKSAKLVQDKVDDPQVKQRAKSIEQDHQKALDELKQIAKSKNIDFASDMDTQRQRLYDQLKDQNKEQLAQSFKQQQIQAHKDTIQLFQQASTELKDPELKQFAQKQLPILQQHLTMIQGNAQGQDQSAMPAGAKLDQQDQPKDKESGYESKDTPMQQNR